MEPSPPNYDRLIQNLAKHSDLCGVRGINNAVVLDSFNSTQKDSLEFYCISKDIDPETGYDSRSGKYLPRFLTQLSSFSMSPLTHNKSVFRKQSLKIKTKVSISSYNELMREIMGGSNDVITTKLRPTLSSMFTYLENKERRSLISPSSYWSTRRALIAASFAEYPRHVSMPSSWVLTSRDISLKLSFLFRCSFFLATISDPRTHPILQGDEEENSQSPKKSWLQTNKDSPGTENGCHSQSRLPEMWRIWEPDHRMLSIHTAVQWIWAKLTVWAGLHLLESLAMTTFWSKRELSERQRQMLGPSAPASAVAGWEMAGIPIVAWGAEGKEQAAVAASKSKNICVKYYYTTSLPVGMPCNEIDSILSLQWNDESICLNTDSGRWFPVD